jgi:hypothetical protein
MTTDGAHMPADNHRPQRPRGRDRRSSTWHALWTGNFERRRQAPRREQDSGFASIDWHHPQWLVLTIVILLMCAIDAVLTLALIGAGGSEVNPVMRPLVTGSGAGFAYWKVGLTSTGVVTLVLLARTRAFGRMPVGRILYAVALCYVALIGYECWLLRAHLGIDSIAGLFPAF